MVVVLGFYGSQSKHVEKYSAVWRNQQGIATVISVPCDGNPLVLVTAGLFEARRALVQIQASGATNVIFHVLSNRGMLIYLSLVYLLLPRNEIKVRGVVFDSCPGGLHPHLFFQATAANQVDPWKRKMYQFMPAAVVMLVLKRFGMKRALIQLGFLELASRAATHIYHLLVSRFDPCKAPTLFLYSEADVLVSASDVEAVIALRRTHISGVHTKKWQDSAHVKHLLQHEEEYVQALQEFVRTL